MSQKMMLFVSRGNQLHLLPNVVVFLCQFLTKLNQEVFQYFQTVTVICEKIHFLGNIIDDAVLLYENII